MTLATAWDAQLRHIEAAGACNFRDLGGYPAADGKRIRHGRVFRSGVMDKLDPNDPVLAPISMAAVIDLRTNRERASRPSNLPAAWSSGLWARDYDQSGGDHASLPQDLDEAGTRAMMHKAYRRMPFEQADGYRVLFQRLAEGQVPLVFHCLGGKDRTGVGAAILLECLGVPREIVRLDYELTEKCLARDRFVVDEGKERFPAELKRNLGPMMRSDPAYIDAMFDKLAKEFGSAQGYVEEVLGIDRAARQRIADLLLEPGN